MLCLLAISGISLIQKKGLLDINKKYFLFFSAFIIFSLISLTGSLNFEAGLIRVKDSLTAGLLGAYIASKDFSRIGKYFFSGLSLAVLFTCLLSLAQFLLGHSLGFWIIGERSFSVTTPLVAKFNYYDRVFLRPYATFSHPNLLAGFLVITLPMIQLGLSKKLYKFDIALRLLGSVAVLVTFSRPALILLGIQILFIYRKLWKLILILFIILSPIVFVRFTSIFTFDTLAILRRKELADYSIELFLREPVFGIGINNFINFLALDKILVGTSRFLQPVHNIFLLILAEAGIFGFLSFTFFLAGAFYENLKKKDRFSKILTESLLIVVFLGLFDHYFLTLPQGQRLLFLILGLSFRRTSGNIR